jgi:acetolactate synthase-1/3 small subunit
MEERHTISCLVENHFGVLARVAGLVSARGFNIESLTVSATEDDSMSRMTIVVRADAMKLEQVKRQLDRLVDVIEIEELRPGRFIDRELLLAAIEPGNEQKKIQAVVQKFGARVVDATQESLILEATGDTPHMDALVDELRALGIKGLARTGRVALKHA